MMATWVWECGVLQSTAELTQANFWLAITPGAMATWVWDVTAAVAIYAIDQGRRELDSARSEDLDPGVRLTRARTRARGAFWQGPSVGSDSYRLPRPSLSTRSGHFSWPPPPKRQVAASPSYNSPLISTTESPCLGVSYLRFSSVTCCVPCGHQVSLFFCTC